MTTAIASRLLDEVLAHAAGAPEAEVCGLLLGAPGRIALVRRANNVAPDPARAFELDPMVLLAAYRAARDGGDRVVGHYHSHPTGNPAPSSCDAAAAAGGELWLVVAAGEARLWRAQAGGPLHGAFAPEPMTVW